MTLRAAIPASLIGLVGALAATALVGPAAAAPSDPACVEKSQGVETCTYREPISINGYEVKQGGFAGIEHPQVNGHITRMETEIVDADGSPVPIQRLMLHHIVFTHFGVQDRTCPGDFLFWDNRTRFASIGERFYAAGEERAKLVLPPGYGYPLQAGDPWGLSYMVMNHKLTPDSAFIQYTVTVRHGAADGGVADATPYWLDVRNCRADPIYNVPGTGEPGDTHRRSMTFTVPESGRIIAGGGHVHGGARMLTLTEPSCDDRLLGRSIPTWGLESHPFYNVRPILHEPGPINMSGFGTAQGIPVQAGEKLRLNSLYEDSAPHVRVMGIMLIYVAHDSSVAGRCGPLPNDIVNVGTSQPGRRGPVQFRVPLTRIDPVTGRATTISKPPGRDVRLGDGARITVGDRYFSRPNVVVRQGARLEWLFKGFELHNLTLANGPVGIGSPNLDQGLRFSLRFRKPGTYRFFCGLHPVQMQERVVVRRKPKR